MEGRVATLEQTTVDARARGRTPGRGIAVVTLALLLVITAGWWALALMPLGQAPPAWVVRTRAACFGSVGSGLPSAGGWVLLIGEPIGMIGTLMAVWGKALRSDLAWLAARGWGKVAMLSTLGALAWGGVLAAQRVLGALDLAGPAAFDVNAAAQPVPRLDLEAPPLVLTDQTGGRFDLAQAKGTPVIVTFAFAHCADVCPTLVHQLREARAQATREVPIVVVTLDPWRDVPERLPHIAKQWSMDAGDKVLSGSVDEVTAVLDGWGIGRARDGATGDISHAAVAFLVAANGRLTARLDGGIDRMRELLATP
ncbi:MAG: SCO family protein [Gemmatimonadaceae bacterium]|nr:SCO family protein [Gemmatimonadaceae bacterium]